MKRIISLHLARGFTVMMIAPIHTMMFYSDPGLYTSILGIIFRFIAEGPGAQLFMLLLGVNFAFKESVSFQNVLKRSGSLLIAGYALNFFKFVLPYSAGCLPAGLKADLNFDRTLSPVLYLLSIGDILHFAAIALLMLYFITRFSSWQIVSVFAAAVVCICSPFCWDISAQNTLINYFLQLISGQPPQTFFPVFPWIVYPLAGLTIGWYLKNGKPGAFDDIRNIGIILILVAKFTEILYHPDVETSFYRTYPAETIEHLAIVLLTLYCWNWLSEHCKNNQLFRILTWNSRNITLIYIIQWLVIASLLPFIPYKQLNMSATIGLMLLTTSVTNMLTVLVEKRKLKISNQ